MPTSSPRIVTNVREPCLVITAHLSGRTTLGELKALFESTLRRVTDVYNCSAYSLDPAPKCENVIALNSPHELAFVCFINTPVKITELSRFEPLRQIALKNKEKIDSILSKIAAGPVELDSYWLETTGKSPN